MLMWMANVVADGCGRTRACTRYYNGTIQGSPDKYALDDHHIFETNKPMLVCGNTASMVEDSWLKPHFNVIGDRTHHFGQCITL